MKKISYWLSYCSLKYLAVEHPHSLAGSLLAFSRGVARGGRPPTGRSPSSPGAEPRVPPAGSAVPYLLLSPPGADVEPPPGGSETEQSGLGLSECLEVLSLNLLLS